MAETLDSLNIPEYLRNTLTKAAGTVSDTMTDVADIMSGAASNTQAETDAMKQSAQAKNEAERLIVARKMGNEAKNKEQIAAFGTNPEASSYILAAMSHRVLDINAELDSRSKDLQEKMGTKFSDDPVGWIANQFTIPGDVLAYTHRAADLDRTNAVMREMIARSKDVVALNAAIDAGTSTEISAALEKQNLAEASVKVAEANQKLATFNLTGVNIRRAASMDQAQLMITAQNAEAKQQELQLARAAGSRAEQSLQLQIEMKNLTMDEKRDKMETDAIIQQKLNNVAALTGTNPITTKEYQQGSAKSRAMYETLMTDPDFNEQRLGFNTAIAVEKSNEYNFPLTPGLNYVRDKLVKIAATVPGSIPSGQTQFDKLKPMEQLAKTQESYIKEVKKERAAIPIEGGIYSPPSLGKVLEIPLVASLSIAKDLKPLAQDKTTPTDPNTIFTTAVTKISKGEATPAQMAREIQFMFQAISVDNNTQRAYKRLVLPMITEKDGFKMNVYSGAGWRGNEVIDMTNSAQLENALMRRVAQSKSEALANQLGYGNAGTPSTGAQ